MEEYYNLISEHRKAGSSRGASPSPAPSKSQKGKREPSSTPSHTASIETSPEPEGYVSHRNKRIYSLLHFHSNLILFDNL
jgi:hypothetical protein